MMKKQNTEPIVDRQFLFSSCDKSPGFKILRGSVAPFNLMAGNIKSSG